MKLEKLKAPIQPHEIHWRVQSKGNNKTTVVPYLTNRCVMERFDEEFGATEWKNTFQEWRSKGVKCGISVWHSGINEWITKYDGADETNIESTKGGFSDSMKRAAVQWGLGRDLYDYPMIQIEGEHKYLSRNHEAQLNEIAAKISSGQKVNDYILIGNNAPKPQPKATPKAQRVIVNKDDEIYKKIVTALANDKSNLKAACDKYNISEDVQKWIKAEVVLLKEQFEKA